MKIGGYNPKEENYLVCNENVLYLSLNELTPSLFDVMDSNEEPFYMHENKSPNAILKEYVILDDKGSKPIDANFSISFYTYSILRFLRMHFG